jgi:hypothetical protein
MITPTPIRPPTTRANFVSVDSPELLDAFTRGATVSVGGSTSDAGGLVVVVDCCVVVETSSSVVVVEARAVEVVEREVVGVGRDVVGGAVVGGSVVGGSVVVVSLVGGSVLGVESVDEVPSRPGS